MRFVLFWGKPSAETGPPARVLGGGTVLGRWLGQMARADVAKFAELDTTRSQLMPHLFAYGTLLVPEIMKSVVGRVPSSAPSVLDGFARFVMKGEVYPGVRACEGASVPGRVFTHLSEAELEVLDAYEGEMYERLLLQFDVESEQSGAEHFEAFVYVVRGPWLSKLSDDAWELERFSREHASSFRVRWR